MIREDLLRTVRDLSASHDTKAFAELVKSVHPSDMAEALETLKSRDVARLLPCLKAGTLAEVFVYFSEERQSRLLQELPRETVVALFEGMAADERVDLFHDLDEAARIDGCSYFGIYLRIILPLIVPALITAGIFSFMWRWDDFLSALLYVKESVRYPASLALKLFCDPGSSSDYGAMFAMSTLSIIPAVTIFIVFQKYLVEGIATSGLKG